MAAKKLVVNLDYHQPEFTFEGTWTGKDVKVVLAHMRRAYLRHQRDTRRPANEQTADESASAGGK